MTNSVSPITTDSFEASSGRSYLIQRFLVGGTLLYLALLVSAWAIAPYEGKWGVQWGTLGTIGDYFGGVANVVALTGVALALVLQSRDLGQQVEATRELLAAQRDALLQQALHSTNSVYWSVEMLDAVTSLWDLWRSAGHDRSKLVEHYREQMDKDKENLQTLTGAQRLEFRASSLHHKRRIVAQYYQYVGNLYENGVIPYDVVYSAWSKKDLEIIPQILRPLEDALAEDLGSGYDPKSSMDTLYEDAPESRLPRKRRDPKK